MKRTLLLIAVAVVLAANAWIMFCTARNRSEALGGTLELTERELHLPPALGESTVIGLELAWDTLSRSPEARGAARWLDAAKLAELGFDCRVPPTHPAARDHYRSRVSAEVFVVLEYEGEAWKQAAADRKRNTRLFVVDAGRQPDLLRRKYPDPSRHVITRGLVRLALEERRGPDGALTEPPYLQGWVEEILPSQIFVPSPWSRTLEGLRRPEDSPVDERQSQPRFVARVAWGSRYEPWVTEIRLLSAGSGAP